MRARRRLHQWQSWFQNQYYLRLHMLLLATATAGAAAAISKGLLLAGITSMAVRFPFAALLSYGVFLCLVRLWLWYITAARPQPEPEPDDITDLPDTLDLISHLAPDPPLPDAPLDFGLDELFAPVLFLVAALAFSGLGFYLIWAAPEILAEVAVSAVLAATFHGGLVRFRDGRWLWTALQRTWLIVASLLLLASLTGWALEKRCPGAQAARAAWSCPEVRR